MTKTILITGCSSGIGHTCAHGLAGRGWHVVASCRRERDVERLRAEGLDCVRLDYEDEDSIARGYEAALAITGGRLDALFNNGAYAVPGMVEDIPAAALRAIFEANVFGWHTLTCHAMRTMRAQGAGRIVQNSSVLGFAALRGRGAYNATKFAIEGLTDTLRLEMRDTDIEIILIEPGPITTKIRENSVPGYERWIKPFKAQSAWLETYETVLEPRLEAEGVLSPHELPPTAVLAKLVHALESPRPNPRYYVTRPTYLAGIAKRLLPTRAFDALSARG